MSSASWRWVLGLIYLFAVATIWIAASFVVQSVVDAGLVVKEEGISEDGDGIESGLENVEIDGNGNVIDETSGVFGKGDEKGHWTRMRVAKVSLMICPFWFLAQLTFNVSLKYTTVTSNTILSRASSLFTFLVSLIFLGEKFTWLKLFSVLLCMSGTIIVSMGDSESNSSAIAKNPLLGDSLSLISAALYAVYITLIRKNLPDVMKETVVSVWLRSLGFWVSSTFSFSFRLLLFSTSQSENASMH